MPCPAGVYIPVIFAAYNAYYAIGKINGLQQYTFCITGSGRDSSHSPSLCVKCGKCEAVCPQQIKIIDSLEVVKKRMEPFWFELIKSIHSWIMNKNAKER
jgi:predicted aldo/keto reductase-like oxidoreductase